jgi:protein O-mannosyl-transferase
MDDRPASSEESDRRTGEPKPWSYLPLVVSLAAAFLVYAPTLRYEFVGDDRYQIVGNPHLQSWHFLGRYFTGHVWSHVELSLPINHYRPIFLLWLRLNYLIFGLAPWGWHLTTVVTHLVVTLLLYVLARRVSGDDWSAGAAALIFGLHPVHLESVAWVSGVTDPLCAVFLLGGCLAYQQARGRAQAGAPRSLASWLLYTLALLSKETAVVLPVLIFIYEWLFGPRAGEASGWERYRSRARAALSASVPYLALTAVYLVARALALRGLAHAQVALPLSTQFLTLPSVLWFYVKHLLWPAGLSAMYDMEYVRRPDFIHFVSPALGAAGTILGLGVWCRRSSRVGFASAWLALPILPVLLLRFQPQDNFVHDRFLYIPSLGLALLAGLAWRRLETSPSRILAHPGTRFIPVALVAGLLAAGTLRQSSYWKDDLVFSQHDLSSLPPGMVPAAQNNLGIALAERGRLAEAVKLWQQMLARDATSFAALYNLGYYSYRAGRLPEAESYLLRALESNPSNATAFLCLGLARFKMGRLDDSEATIRRAIALRPEGFGSHFALGFVLKTRGDRAGALREFRAELANNPANQAARDQIREIEMNR